MPVYVIQPSFAGGELAPSLHARVDLAKYSVGLKTCRNFIVQAHGGVTNRAGTKYVCDTKDSTNKTRLIPFSFNTEQTYALEFGHQTMRVIKDGGQVSSGGNPVEISTPYSDSELSNLKFTQSADVMTICHPSHPVKELKRTSHTSWTLTDVVFGTTMSAPTGVSSTAENFDSADPDTSFSFVVTAVETETGSESIQSSATTVTNNNLSSTITNTITWNSVSGADSYNVYKSKGGIYGFVGRSTGTTFKDDNIAADASDSPALARTIFNATDKYPSTVSYYQQRLTFAQSNEEPQTVWMSQTGNYNNFNVSQPLKDDDSVTFTIASSQVNEIRHMVALGNLVILTSGGEWLMLSSDGNVVTPTSVKLEPQGYRGVSDVAPLVVGNTILYIQSKDNIVRDLAYTQDSGGYTGNDLTVLSNHLFLGKTIVSWAYSQAPHSVVWVVLSDGSLLSLTYLREHEVWGWARHDTDGSFESVCTISEGSEDATYFVVKRDINGETKRLVERLNTRTFSDVKDCYFVDCGLSYDGTHTGSTTMKLSGGSSWNSTEDLTLESSASTFVSGDVGNTIVLTIGEETLVCNIQSYTSATEVTVRAARDVPLTFRAVSWFALAVLVARYNTGLTTSAENALLETNVTYNGATRQLGDIDGSGSIDASDVTKLLRQSAGLESYPYLTDFVQDHIISSTSWNPISVENNGITYYIKSQTTSTWAKGVDELSGLSHLEGKTVSVLADGGVESQKIVSSGAITLSNPATKIHVGLPIQADIETLDLELGQPTSQGKVKSVATVTMRVEKSRGGKVGASLDRLTEFKQRTHESYGEPTALKTGDIRVTIPSQWSSSGSIFYRQDDPLPMTLLAVIPEVSLGN